jgi:hypothetical protein
MSDKKATISEVQKMSGKRFLAGLKLARSIDHGFLALIKTPSVFPELLNPVLYLSLTSSNPVELIISRKSFPGIAPPSHLYQLATMPFIDCGGSPART